VDLWTYFAQRERECEEMSLVPCDDVPLQFRELAGFEWERGRMVGRLHIGERAYISMVEVVEVVDGSYIRRLEYAYFLIVDGAEFYGRERDPTHDPAEHGHGRFHEREDAGPISFVDFVEQCWAMVSDLPDEEIDDDYQPSL
jgi:hypothetical protein